MKYLARIIVAMLVIIPNVGKTSMLESGPTIKSISFQDGIINCYSGGYFMIQTSEMTPSVQLQIFESKNGKDFFIHQTDVRPLRSSHDLYTFPCPASSSDSVFQVRLVDETSAGNMLPISYSSGAKPYVDSLYEEPGRIVAQGKNLSGSIEVYYKGNMRGVVYGSQSRAEIPSSIHQNFAGLYTLRNPHGQSNSFFLKPYTKATFGYATSPTLLHNNELRNNCKSFYNSTLDVGTIAGGTQNICSLENAYSFWGLKDERPSADEVQVFLDIPLLENSITAKSPEGVGSRVELVVAVDSEQLKSYPEYYNFAVTTGDITEKSGSIFFDFKPHYVPVYKAVYLGESRLMLDARTSIAAHVVLDVVKSKKGPEITANEYKLALQSSLMATAVSRYNYLLGQTVTVDYGGRKALHHIASPLYFNDANLNSIIHSLASEVKSKTASQ